MDLTSALVIIIVLAVVVATVVMYLARFGGTSFRIMRIKSSPYKTDSTHGTHSLHKVSLSPHIVELINNRQDEEALSEIRKTTDLDDAFAKDLIEQLRKSGGPQEKLFISKSSHKVSLPPHVHELIKNHQDAQALSEIEKATGLSSTLAQEVLEQLRNIPKSGGVRTETHRYKISSDVVKMLREGRREQAIAKFASDVGISSDEAKWVLAEIDLSRHHE